MKQKKSKDRRLISWQRHWFNGLVCNHKRFWKKLADFETKVLEFDLETVKIDKPIYVTGLARSGSTVALEFLASQKSVVSHRYSDFPFLFTPYFWRLLSRLMRLKPSKAKERFHGDGMMVTSESPEAMEEVLWMYFFDSLHNREDSEILNLRDKNEDFDTFYQDHIKKLLLVSKGERYLAKANYNISRIDYILNICPDAKFIIPVRDPLTHVDSLVRQHENFYQRTHADKRALKHLERVGHFEFGADLRPICLDEDTSYNEIVELFNSGKTIQAYARYWAYIYSYIWEHYKDHKSVMIYQYEDFCDNSERVLKAMIQFCDLDIPQDQINIWAARLNKPAHSDIEFSKEDKVVIYKETKNTMTHFGYKEEL